MPAMPCARSILLVLSVFPVLLHGLIISTPDAASPNVPTTIHYQRSRNDPQEIAINVMNSSHQISGSERFTLDKRRGTFDITLGIVGRITLEAVDLNEPPEFLTATGPFRSQRSDGDPAESSPSPTNGETDDTQETAQPTQTGSAVTTSFPTATSGASETESTANDAGQGPTTPGVDPTPTPIPGNGSNTSGPSQSSQSAPASRSIPSGVIAGIVVGCLLLLILILALILFLRRRRKGETVSRRFTFYRDRMVKPVDTMSSTSTLSTLPGPAVANGTLARDVESGNFNRGNGW